MDKKKLLCAIAGTMMLIMPQAYATGSLHCEAEDKSLTFQVSGVVSRGVGSRIMNFKGESQIKLPKIADDLKTLSYEQDHLVHSWLSGRELKLHLYREREGEKRHGYVEIVIETTLKSKTEGAYAGKYNAEVYDLPEGASETKPVKFNGAIRCSAD
ncbi:hypothetical protein GJW-30_1_03222 [Variibacter gotjawalensis]|uniref:Uncharacterized protein n=1 Tax=Variibacter gotjawalensis TaxID=1333996 RepID=A0A0S3PXK5_9BRAD|nr:hypothetical protein [Variibacter gotjawalensis]NIK46506.1 hypothetical protein [Variibacter gotjawalensis]RZS48414.1 hypothetical protein EV661_0826 [Variibacter gotjawalensis]BAT60673.1 hypothetical protein GJW-30_1_03222 [Variibacter gotjawalensis]